MKEDIMAVEIPKGVQREVFLIRQGKKLKKRAKEEPSYSIKELFSVAVKKLEFLNEIANTEPIFSFLNESGKAILILSDFNAFYPQAYKCYNLGRLVLVKKENKAALYDIYDWTNADNLMDQGKKGCYLVTKEQLEKWHTDSLKQFALLTERRIWENIKDRLRFIRSCL